MIGAIAGDIIGSPYEFGALKTTEFPLFGPQCRFTDDTVLTVALADAIIHDEDYVSLMKRYYHRFPDVGYGGTFIKWAASSETQPYNSFGNGAAMRISPVGFYYDTLEEVLAKAEQFTAVTHNHPEGIRGAQATAASIFLARNGSSKDDIRRYVTETFGYDLNRTCDQIRPNYSFDVTCQGSVPEAIICFLESNDYESAVRLAVSLGGDSDTLACIAGGIAEGFCGVPLWIEEKTLQYLDSQLQNITGSFYRSLCFRIGTDLSRKKVITPADLRRAIAEWEECVEWISHGYDEYEYDNDVSFREYLADALERYCAIRPLHQADADRLQLIDEKFRQVTVETDQCVYTDRRGNPESVLNGHVGLSLAEIKEKYWYYFRWPIGFDECDEQDDFE
jgi:ADP-ribosylglycohydrolase